MSNSRAKAWKERIGLSLIRRQFCWGKPFLVKKCFPHAPFGKAGYCVPGGAVVKPHLAHNQGFLEGVWGNFFHLKEVSPKSVYESGLSRSSAVSLGATVIVVLLLLTAIDAHPCQDASVVSGVRGPAAATNRVERDEVPSVQVAPSVALSFERAIQLALQNNVGVLLATERDVEARGQALQSAAGLMPNLAGASYQANLTQNLAAFGFQPRMFPGLSSTFVGPFNYFDARVQLVQSVFNLSAIRQFQAGRTNVTIAGLQKRLVRQQVTTAAALAYVDAVRAKLGVEAAQADLELARALLKLAQDQKTAGIASGVDVARAETRLAEVQVRLAQALLAAQQTCLQLQRVVGLPLGSTLSLTDTLRFTIEPLPSVTEAVAAAERDRVEMQIAEEQVRLSDYERQAVQAEQWPSVDFVANYGVSGIKPSELALPTRQYGIRLNLPIFNGGLSRGRLAVAASHKRQSELKLNDLRSQIEQEVRLALETLLTTTAQVRSAEQSVALAQRELQMAQDRFGAGVGDNIEVITAQAALARARDAHIAALAQYSAARINLAAAMGRVESFRW